MNAHFETYRIPMLIVALGIIVAGIVILENDTPTAASSEKTLGGEYVRNDLPRAKEIALPSGFINTEPFQLESYIGTKVILIDFWTYSCINCQRTTPYLTAWDRAYRDHGLLIIGIHTPEFEFEKNIENVRSAVTEFGITYPVVLDNEYATWNAYGNRYWPRKYLIDVNGNIVYDHIGEGAYEATEKKIREELARLGEITGKTFSNIAMAEVGTAEIPLMEKPRTPEIYFGAWRNERLGNGSSGVEGENGFRAPAEPARDFFYLSGRWNVTREYVEAVEPNTRIILPYQAQKVFMVARAEKTVRIKVLLDGKPIPESMRGDDVDRKGYLTVGQDRLYRIIEDSTWGQHELELVIESPGFQIFTFTFG